MRGISLNGLMRANRYRRNGNGGASFSVWMPGDLSFHDDLKAIQSKIEDFNMSEWARDVLTKDIRLLRKEVEQEKKTKG
jgi:hypothetical protein